MNLYYAPSKEEIKTQCQIYFVVNTDAVFPLGCILKYTQYCMHPGTLSLLWGEQV